MGAFTYPIYLFHFRDHALAKFVSIHAEILNRLSHLFSSLANYVFAHGELCDLPPCAETITSAWCFVHEIDTSRLDTNLIFIAMIVSRRTRHSHRHDRIHENPDRPISKGWVENRHISVTARRFLLHHDDVIKWKHFPHYWPFVRGIRRSSVNYPRKDQWREVLMFSLICAWANSWANNGDPGDFRRQTRSLWRHCNDSKLNKTYYALKQRTF